MLLVSIQETGVRGLSCPSQRRKSVRRKAGSRQAFGLGYSSIPTIHFSNLQRKLRQ
jgi:hypothetical protein